MLRTMLLRASFLTALGAVSSCGGGGGGGSESNENPSSGANNRPPEISGSTSFTFAETDLISFSLDVTDPDGDTVTVIVGDSGDGQFFLLNTATGEITANTSTGQFDFENPLDADGNNIYEQTVSLNDGSTTVETTVTVTITDVDEGPIFTNANRVDLFENQTGVVVTFTAEDPEGTAVSDFQIEQVSKFAEVVNAQRLLDAFEIDPDTGELSVIIPFDAESEGTTDVITVAVSAQDEGGIRNSSGVNIQLIDLPAVAVEGASIRGRQSFLSLGAELADIGDIDSDGRGDVWVTEALPESFQTDVPPPVETAFLIFGRAIENAISQGGGVADLAIDEFAPGDVIEFTGQTYTAFGAERSALTAHPTGDVDGDSSPDLLVGFRELRDERDVGDDEDGPLAALLFGSALQSTGNDSIDLTSLSASQGITFSGLSERAALGLRLAAGDLDRDGIPDIVLSSTGDRRLRIVFGSYLRGVAGGTTVDLDALAAGEGLTVEFVDTVRNAIEQPGDALAVLPDVDGSGGDELVVLFPGFNDRTIIISDVLVTEAKNTQTTTLNALDGDLDGVITLSVADVRILGLDSSGDLDADGSPDLTFVCRGDNLRSEVSSVVFAETIGTLLDTDQDFDIFQAAPEEAVTALLSNAVLVQDTTTAPTAQVIPDVTGDADGELLIGLNLDDALGRENSGSFLIVNGASLRAAPSGMLTLSRDALGLDEGRRLIGPSSGSFVGDQVFTADIDNDGKRELIVASETALELDNPLGRLFVLPGDRIEQIFQDSDDQYDLAASIALEAIPVE